MSEKSTKREVSEVIEAIAERAERGEDVSANFTNRHVARQWSAMNGCVKL